MNIWYQAKNKNLILEEADLPKIERKEEIVKPNVFFLGDKEQVIEDDNGAKLFKVVYSGLTEGIYAGDLVVVEIYTPLPKIDDKQYYSANEAYVLAKILKDSEELITKEIK